MKASGQKSPARRAIALALTWDGARQPVWTLPPRARAFLTGRSRELPSAQKMAELFAAGEVNEIRVCWVPRLKGGPDALAEPFFTASGKRLSFLPTKATPFGDILGVVYRR